MNFNTEQVIEALYENSDPISIDAAEHMQELAQQRAELLEALKLLHSNFRSQHAHLLILGAPDFVHMDKVAEKAITKAEAAE